MHVSELFINGIPMVPIVNGNVFWLNNSATFKSDAANYGQRRETPFSTLAYALTQCVAGRGDMILVGPGHVETVNAAAFITASISGVSIVGVGNGALRPTFNWTATASQIIISGANVLLKNLILNFAGIDAVVAAISVTGADVAFEDCEITTNNGTMGCVLGIVSAATATRLRIERNLFLGPAVNSGTTTTAQIKHEVGVDYLIKENYFTGKMTQAILNATALLRGRIDMNRFVIATGTVAITMHASSTPFITNNRINVPSGTAPIVAAAGFVAGNIYSAAAGVTAGTASTI